MHWISPKHQRIQHLMAIPSFAKDMSVGNRVKYGSQQLIHNRIVEPLENLSNDTLANLPKDSTSKSTVSLAEQIKKRYARTATRRIGGQ